MSEGVLVVGVSTRALVESATRAGQRCEAVDAFGDLDQRAPTRTPARELGRRYSPAALVALARGSAAGAVAYVANLENHPAAVRRLAAGRVLLGNTPHSLHLARDPWRVAAAVRAAGGRVPATLTPAEAGRADPATEWLRKPMRGGGGSGVRRWRPGEALSARELAQQRVHGSLASAAFVADGRRARLLGLSMQMAGDEAFGASEHRYCGSVYPLPDGDGTLAARLQAIADEATTRFGLRGANGIDFVLRDGEPYVLEINPRPTASMELIERATGLSIFDAHAAGCRGALCDEPHAPAATHAKAILYARRDAVLPDTRPWLARDHLRDLPHPGERIARGRPICTLLAGGADAASCREALLRAAAALEREIHEDAHR